MAQQSSLRDAWKWALPDTTAPRKGVAPAGLSKPRTSVLCLNEKWGTLSVWKEKRSPAGRVDAMNKTNWPLLPTQLHQELRTRSECAVNLLFDKKGVNKRWLLIAHSFLSPSGKAGDFLLDCEAGTTTGIVLIVVFAKMASYQPTANMFSVPRYCFVVHSIFYLKRHIIGIKGWSWCTTWRSFCLLLQKDYFRQTSFSCILFVVTAAAFLIFCERETVGVDLTYVEVLVWASVD